MNQEINVKALAVGKETYPSWSTGSTYLLKVKEYKNEALVHYRISGGRKISRPFPKVINLSKQFCYVMGLLKGEGSNALGKSNYRRLTITNSDPKVIRIILFELERSKLLSTSKFKPKTIHLMHSTKSKKDLIAYWSKELDLPKEIFVCYKDKMKKSKYGVCHVYLSDVLLRRVIDLIHETFF